MLRGGGGGIVLKFLRGWNTKSPHGTRNPHTKSPHGTRNPHTEHEIPTRNPHTKSPTPAITGYADFHSLTAHGGAAARLMKYVVVASFVLPRGAPSGTDRVLRKAQHYVEDSPVDEMRSGTLCTSKADSRRNRQSPSQSPAVRWELRSACPAVNNVKGRSMREGTKHAGYQRRVRRAHCLHNARRPPPLL